VEKEILEADDKVGKSVDLLCLMCKKILEETKAGRSFRTSTRTQIGAWLTFRVKAPTDARGRRIFCVGQDVVLKRSPV
jgi:hypothetical protein